MIGLFYFSVCLILTIVVALQRHQNKRSWALQSAAFLLVILFLWLTARWELLTIYLRHLMPVVFLLGALWSFFRIDSSQAPTSRFARIAGNALNGGILFVMVVMFGLALRGYRAPLEMVDLASPLRTNQYLVLNGGGSPQINAHAKIAPQNYALDIVGLNAWGRNGTGFTDPKPLTDYAIYGDSLFSPVEGTILATQDGLPDQLPPTTDSKNLAGNYVVIGFQGKRILLGHLQAGSVSVKPGDAVTTTSYLGKVGNSGNSSEPHLHLHVEEGGETKTILSGKAVPFTLNGRFLVRGNTLKN